MGAEDAPNGQVTRKPTADELRYIRSHLRVPRRGLVLGGVLLLMLGASIAPMFGGWIAVALGEIPGLLLLLFARLRGRAALVLDGEVETLRGVYSVRTIHGRHQIVLHYVGDLRVELPDHWADRMAEGLEVEVEAYIRSSTRIEKTMFGSTACGILLRVDGFLSVAREVPLGMLKLRQGFALPCFVIALTLYGLQGLFATYDANGGGHPTALLIRLIRHGTDPQTVDNIVAAQSVRPKLGHPLRIARASATCSTYSNKGPTPTALLFDPPAPVIAKKQISRLESRLRLRVQLVAELRRADSDSLLDPTVQRRFEVVLSNNSELIELIDALGNGTADKKLWGKFHEAEANLISSASYKLTGRWAHRRPTIGYDDTSPCASLQITPAQLTRDAAAAIALIKRTLEAVATRPQPITGVMVKEHCHSVHPCPFTLEPWDGHPTVTLVTVHLMLGLAVVFGVLSLIGFKRRRQVRRRILPYPH